MHFQTLSYMYLIIDLFVEIVFFPLANENWQMPESSH